TDARGDGVAEAAAIADPGALGIGEHLEADLPDGAVQVALKPVQVGGVVADLKHGDGRKDLRVRDPREIDVERTLDVGRDGDAGRDAGAGRDGAGGRPPARRHRV